MGWEPEGALALWDGSDLAWEASVDARFDTAAVSDDGMVAAVVDGYPSWTLGFLRDGRVLKQYDFELHSSGSVDGIPWPTFQSLEVGGQGERFLLCTCPEGPDVKFARVFVFDASSGEQVGVFDLTSSRPNRHGWTERPISIRAIPDTPLLLVLWWLDPWEGPWGSDVRVVDLRGRTIWERALVGDFLDGDGRTSHPLIDSVMEGGGDKYVWPAPSARFVITSHRERRSSWYQVKEEGGEWQVTQTSESPWILGPSSSASP